MKFRGTKADLERWIDWVDDNLRHVPHGQTVRSGDGPERRLTVREMFTHVLDHLDRLGPDAVVRGNLLPFEEYWRQTMLSCFPPDKRYDSEYVKRRLQKKGAHLIVLPAVSVPVLCASGMHFKVETAVGVDDHCAVKVSIPPSIYRRKKVLGQMTRYREDGRIIFCYGSPAVVHSFIQGQRGGDAPDVPDILRRYAVDVLGRPPETVEHYVSQDYCVLDGLTPAGRRSSRSVHGSDQPELGD